jgi:hypothetical protein
VPPASCSPGVRAVNAVAAQWVPASPAQKVGIDAGPAGEVDGGATARQDLDHCVGVSYSIFQNQTPRPTV